jgi:hypothetical protein
MLNFRIWFSHSSLLSISFFFLFFKSNPTHDYTRNVYIYIYSQSSCQGLSTLSELRVLNLAGNKIEVVTGVSNLSSLTELNVRRNKITTILDESIDKLFNLQRIFMSNNQVSSFASIGSLLKMSHLLELTLDGNPIAINEGEIYRRSLLTSLTNLRDLDLRKISDSDRKVCMYTCVHTYIYMRGSCILLSLSLQICLFVFAYVFAQKKCKQKQNTCKT